MPATVIIIDDDQDDLDIMNESIKAIDRSIACLTFKYPDEALKVVSQELVLAPDYMFIDINMPVITGDLLLKEFRKYPELDSAIITMFSTSIPATVTKLLKDSGANFTFQKPNRVEDYKAILSQIIR